MEYIVDGDGPSMTKVTHGMHSFHIPLPYEEVLRRWDLWQGGESIQRIFGMLNADTREFMMTGIIPEEWDAMFPPETR